MSGALLAGDMGIGKTAMALCLVQALEVNRTLVLCPKAVMTSKTWSTNARKHMENPLTVYEAIAQSGDTIKDRIINAQHRIQSTRSPIVVVMNYDVLDYDYVIKWIQAQRFEMLILDEEHKLKSPSGKRSHAFWKIAATIKYRLGLTGTPMPHSPADIWAQFKGLDAGIFPSSFGRFMDRYAQKGGYQNREVKKWINIDELNTKIHQITYRVGAEVLDLPPVRHEEVIIELGSKAKELYDTLDDDFYAMIDDTHEITVSNVLVQIIRQQQITSGFVRDDLGRDIEIDNGKEEALKDILSKIQPPTKDHLGRRVEGEPLVVFCKFRHDLDVVKRSAESAGFVYSELSGRKDELGKFNGGDADVIGVQIQSGGSGISLVRARYCVYYSVGWSLGDYMQSLARIARPGQERAVTYYHLVMRGFIDSDVYQALQGRSDIIDRVIDKVKERRPIAHVSGQKPKDGSLDILQNVGVKNAEGLFGV